MKINRMKLFKTRFKNLFFANTGPGVWRFINTDGGYESSVGPHYLSKAELLGDLTRYATEYGAELIG